MTIIKLETVFISRTILHMASVAIIVPIFKDIKYASTVSPCAYSDREMFGYKTLYITFTKITKKNK